MRVRGVTDQCADSRGPVRATGCKQCLEHRLKALSARRGLHRSAVVNDNGVANQICFSRVGLYDVRAGLSTSAWRIPSVQARWRQSSSTSDDDGLGTRRGKLMPLNATAQITHATAPTQERILRGSGVPLRVGE